MNAPQRDIWRVALPMLLAGISTPLIGIVDTAVLGHLDSPAALAAVAAGAAIFSLLFWMFGFLRMSVTGQVAGFYGAEDDAACRGVLLQSVGLACGLAVLMLLFRQPVETLAIYIYPFELQVSQQFSDYFSIRIWSAPATLISYVLMGWMLGLQMMRSTVLVVVLVNLLNIMLDLWLVVGMNMTADGVALASVIAEYTGVLLAGLLVFIRLGKFESTRSIWLAWRKLLAMNIDMFLRTVSLLAVFLLFNWLSAGLGTSLLAVNAILLNFQTFMAYVLDAFAHAAETLVGQASGQRDPARIRALVRASGWFSFWTALGFAVFYLLAGDWVVAMMTSQLPIRAQAADYLLWVALMPLVGWAAYWMDGVFIGLRWYSAMRNLMLMALPAFLLFWSWFSGLGNHGLWAAMLGFMLFRSVVMFAYWRNRYPRLYQ